jgi:hypothetical protein
MAFLLDANWNWSEISISLSANQNDWAPTGLSGASLIWVNASTPINITGLTGGEEQRIIIIGIRVASSNVTLPGEDVLSSGPNRWRSTRVLSQASPCQCFMYIGGRWRQCW